MKRFAPFVLPAVFGLLFIVTALFVLAYALGYQIDLKHRRIEKTGLAYLTSFPASAFITVDNHYIKKKTPNKTQPLLPGRHSLKVEKSGYIPWEVTAQIKPELATLYEHILLFPVKPQISRLQPKGAVSQTVVSQDQAHLAYSVLNGTDAGVWTASLNLGSPKKILPLTTIATPNVSAAAVASFTQFSLQAISDDGSSLLVAASKPGASALLLVPVSSPSSAVVLTDSYKDFGDFRFEPGQSRRLFAIKSGSLYRIDTSGTAAPSLIADDVVAYTAKPGTVTYVRTSTAGTGLYAANSDGTGASLLLSKLTDGQYLLSDDPSSDAVALLSSGDGQLRVVSRNSSQQVQVLIAGSGFSYVKWSRTDSRLLYGGPGGAFVYDLPDVVTTQAVSAGIAAQNIGWMYDAYHVLYLNGDNVTVAEDDGQNVTVLAQSGVLPAYSNSSKDLYIAASSGELTAQSTRQKAD